MSMKYILFLLPLPIHGIDYFFLHLVTNVCPPTMGGGGPLMVRGIYQLSQAKQASSERTKNKKNRKTGKQEKEKKATISDR